MSLILVKLFKMESQNRAIFFVNGRRGEFPCFSRDVTKMVPNAMVQIPAPYLSDVCSFWWTKPYLWIRMYHGKTKGTFGPSTCQVFAELWGILATTPKSNKARRFSRI